MYNAAGLLYFSIVDILEYELESTACTHCGQLVVSVSGFSPDVRCEERGVRLESGTEIPGVWLLRV